MRQSATDAVRHARIVERRRGHSSRSLAARVAHAL